MLIFAVAWLIVFVSSYLGTVQMKQLFFRFSLTFWFSFPHPKQVLYTYDRLCNMYLMAAGSVDSSAGLIGGDIVSTCTTWCCGVLWFVYTVIVLYAECPGYFPFDHVSSSDTFNSDVAWLHVSGKIPFALFYASNQCACCDWIPFFLPHVIHLTLHGQDFILVLCWHLPFYISN